MDFHFTDVQHVEQNGVRYMLQRAVVGNNPRFWSLWRTRVANREELKNSSRLVLRREYGEWVAYRLKPLDNSLPFGKFSLAYSLKSRAKLLPYQPRCVEHLCNAMVRHGHAVDGSDTGLGKTYTSLAVCREMGLRPAVICRKPGIAGWKRACEYFGMTPLFIVNWEYAKSAKMSRFVTRTHAEYANWFEYRWTLPNGSLLIFDEAHMANHAYSQNNMLYTASRPYASLSLSATFADRPSRLGAMFEVLGIMDKQRFAAWLRERGGLQLADSDEMESMSDRQDMLEINRLIYPEYGYRLSYDDPDVMRYFPEAVHLVNVMTLPPLATRQQNKLFRELVEKVERYRELGKQAEVMVADLRYRQAAELLKADTLAELAQELIYEGKSVIIFVNFRETLARLAKLLNTRSLIYGGQESHGIDRERVIEEFQANRSRLILSMVDAGGQSISLHDLHGGHQRVSLVCPTYNPISLVQVLGRTRRAGAKSTPIMQLVYAAGTVEEKVASRVITKIRNIEALNDGDLTEDDIFKLGVDRND